MLTPEIIRKQIEEITGELISFGLSSNQSFPSKRVYGTKTKVDFGECDISFTLKNIPYKEIYDGLLKTKSYSFMIIDGAIVQLMYKFSSDKLIAHRLAFYPSPYLEEYQNNPEIYEIDEIYSDIIRRDIVAFPIRFDFDSNKKVAVDIHHPSSHLTLGQYKNCRIPVSSPLAPCSFIHFILRNFYNTAYLSHAEKMKIFHEKFNETITPNEKALLHINIP